MAIGILRLDKLFENNNTGYYKITAQDKDSVVFFISINKTNRIISFYLSDDFLYPIKEINPDSYDGPIGSLPGVLMQDYSRALLKALKILNAENFPEEIVTAS